MAQRWKTVRATSQLGSPLALFVAVGGFVNHGTTRANETRGNCALLASLMNDRLAIRQRRADFSQSDT